MPWYSKVDATFSLRYPHCLALNQPCVSVKTHVYFFSSVLIIVTVLWEQRSLMYSMTALVLLFESLALKLNFEHDSIRVLRRNSLFWNTPADALTKWPRALNWSHHKGIHSDSCSHQDTELHNWASEKTFHNISLSQYLCCWMCCVSMCLSLLKCNCVFVRIFDQPGFDAGASPLLWHSVSILLILFLPETGI